MAIDYSKHPPGVMLYDPDYISELTIGVRFYTIGKVFCCFIKDPWPDEKTKAETIEEIRNFIKKCADRDDDIALQQGSGIALYKFLLSSAARSLKQYRKKQKDGSDGGFKGHQNRQENSTDSQ